MTHSKNSQSPESCPPSSAELVARLRAALQALYECQASSDSVTEWRPKFDEAMRLAREALAGAGDDHERR